MKEDKPELQYQPVPEWGSRASRFRPWGADTDGGRFEVTVPQPPTKKDDDWVVTVKVLKRPGEGPVVASLLIEPAWWALHRKRANDPEWATWEDPSLYKDEPFPYMYEEDNPSEVPPGGLTRSRVVQMSWENWREAAHEWLADLAPEELKARGLDIEDVELAAPRKTGSRHRMTDLVRARVAVVYWSACLRDKPTGPEVAKYLGVSEKRARNLIAELRTKGFLTKTEGKKPGGVPTQKTKDILGKSAQTRRSEGGTGQ